MLSFLSTNPYWWIAGGIIFAAFALSKGLSDVARALDGLRQEAASFNEDRRTRERLERMVEKP